MQRRLLGASRLGTQAKWHMLRLAVVWANLKVDDGRLCHGEKWGLARGGMSRERVLLKAFWKTRKSGAAMSGRGRDLPDGLRQAMSAPTDSGRREHRHAAKKRWRRWVDR